MAGLLGVAAGQAPQASWWDRAPTATSERYVIKTDLSAREARAYARHLDRVYEEYDRRLASLPPRVPEELHVYVFARRSEFEQTLRARWGVDATGAGGMFFVAAQGRGLAFWTENLSERRLHHVIQHEGFHQFAFSRFGGDLPPWLNEGLAEFFGEAVLVGDTFVLGQSTPRVIDSVKEAIEVGAYVPFAKLFAMTGADWSEKVKGGDAAAAYHQAWSMVHFLVYGDGDRYQGHFERCLRMINNGSDWETAFVEVFGPDIDAFEQRWKQHALRARPGAFVTALERIEFLAEGARELSRRGVVPDHLETLTAALREIDFAHTVVAHDRSVTLRATEDANFRIPEDDLSREPPLFTVTAPNLRRLTLRQRRQEERWPTPCTIVTEHLRPRELGIRWLRDRETAEIRYEIVVR